MRDQPAIGAQSGNLQGVRKTVFSDLSGARAVFSVLLVSVQLGDYTRDETMEHHIKTEMAGGV
jgi:hypothetical protein